jgi:penicillin-binding protein 1C
MVEVSRPDEESAWKEYSFSYPIAWKTGTSFGCRDAWSVGVTPSYVIAVWVGNATGEGRPGLTGISLAAPILFDIFSLIKKKEWFEQPYDEMEKIMVCSQSGHRALPICFPIDSIYIPKSGLRTPPCPYHRMVHLDKTKQYRVNSECASTDDMVHVPWFVLPPSQEWYYKSKSPTYQQLPPLKPGCMSVAHSMEIIYPKDAARVYVPIELNGSAGKTVFQVAHRKTNAVIYWHLDENYIGNTSGIHEMGLNPNFGKHKLTLVDEVGETLNQEFEIIKK